MRQRGRSLWFGVLLAGCISQSPPAPAPRWFDPMPAPTAARPALPPLRVAGAPFLRQEFVVRVGPRELAVDELHRWTAAPERLVARTLGVPDSSYGGSNAAVEVLVTRFELDTTAAPRAVIEVTIDAGGHARAVTVDAVAAGREPEQVAAAMADALAKLPAALAAALGDAQR